MIEWKKYDKDNPPKEGIYLICDGYMNQQRLYRGNFKHERWSVIGIGFIRDVTHYAEINFPEVPHD